MKIKKKPHDNAASADVIEAVAKEDLVNLNFQISKIKRQDLKIKVASQGKKIGEVMNQMIDDYLAKN